MCDHDVARCQRRRHLPKDIEKRVVVGNKNLNDVAHFGELGWSPDKIRNRSRVSVPNKDVKPEPAQIVGDAASDNAESDYANIFSGSTRHWLRGFFPR